MELESARASIAKAEGELQEARVWRLQELLDIAKKERDEARQECCKLQCSLLLLQHTRLLCLHVLLPIHRPAASSTPPLALHDRAVGISVGMFTDFLGVRWSYYLAFSILGSTTAEELEYQLLCAAVELESAMATAKAKGKLQEARLWRLQEPPGHPILRLHLLLLILCRRQECSNLQHRLFLF